MIKYIVSEMVADESAQYHAMRKPIAFDDKERAMEHAFCRAKTEYSPSNGYVQQEIVHRTDETGAVDFITAYFNSGFAELRIDSLEL